MTFSLGIHQVHLLNVQRAIPGLLAAGCAPLLVAGCASLSPETASSASAHAPLATNASVAWPAYRSAWIGYKGFSSAEDPAGRWRAVNEKVEQIGGWKTYAKEPVPKP